MRELAWHNDLAHLRSLSRGENATSDTVCCGMGATASLRHSARHRNARKASTASLLRSRSVPEALKALVAPEAPRDPAVLWLLTAPRPAARAR